MLCLCVPNWYTVGPNAPADVQVTFNRGALRAIVSWMPAEGALIYSVTASSGLLKLKCNTSSASCVVSSLQCGSEYYVSVTAYNDAGSSKPTDAVSLKTCMCHSSLYSLWHLKNHLFHFKCKLLYYNSWVSQIFSNSYFCFWTVCMNCAIYLSISGTIT